MTIKALRIQNRNLIKERNAITSGTAIGKQRMDEFNRDIDKNTRTLKEVEKQLSRR